MTDPADDDLLARLGTLFTRVDPMPEAVAEAARTALSWRSADAELALLVADSMHSTAAVRGSDARLLTFETGELILELEVQPRPAGRLRVVGQLIAPQITRVRAEQPRAAAEATPDDLGRFTLPDLATGPTRFVCAPAFHTDWTIL